MNHNYFYVIKTHHVENGKDYSDFDAVYPDYDSAVTSIRRNVCDLSENGYNQWLTLWRGVYGCYSSLELEEIYKWNKETNRYEKKEFKDTKERNLKMKQIKTMEIILEVSGMLLALIGIFSIAFTGRIGFETTEEIIYFLIHLVLYTYCGFCFGKTIYRKS